MSALFVMLARYRTRFMAATAVSVVLQLLLLFTPGLAGMRPLLAALCATVPYAVVALLPAPGAPDQSFSGYSYHRENVLGTSLDVYVATDSESEAQACEAAVVDEICRLETILDSRAETSECARVNRGEAPATLSPELQEVLQLCEQWRIHSDGAFDPRIGELVRLWRQAVSTQQVPEQATLQALCARRAEQPLNVDALGKAYILDRAAQVAQEKTGVRGLLLNIGGDIVARGDCNPQPGKGWRVGIANPHRHEDNAVPLSYLRLRDQAVATSAAYERPLTIAGQSYSHILDPRSGQPATGVASATVIAPTAAAANALATALCVLSPEEGLQLVARTDDVECLLVTADGTEQRSPGFVAETEASCDAMAWPKGHELIVGVTLTKQMSGKKIRRPYVAVWIEDDKGNAVRTLAVWGNERKYLSSLSAWWKFAGRDSDLVKTVTKATRAAGEYSLVWDGTDDKGKTVAPGTYTIRMEVNREHGRHVQQSGKIECGEKKVTIKLDATAETGESQAKYGPREK